MTKPRSFQLFKIASPQNLNKKRVIRVSLTRLQKLLQCLPLTTHICVQHHMKLILWRIRRRGEENNCKLEFEPNLPIPFPGLIAIAPKSIAKTVILYISL